MNLTFSFRLAFGVVCTSLVCSCATNQHDKREIELAMQKYDRLILAMNEDSIALLYAEDGHLGQAVQGRDSIRKFLGTFKDYHLISQASTIDSTSVDDQTGFQK